MSRFLHITLPGTGSNLFSHAGEGATSIAPTAVIRPPTRVKASRSVAQQASLRRKRGIANTIRNEGGARGISISSVSRALKTLTGQ